MVTAALLWRSHKRECSTAGQPWGQAMPMADWLDTRIASSMTPKLPRIFIGLMRHAVSSSTAIAGCPRLPSSAIGVAKPEEV